MEISSPPGNVIGTIEQDWSIFPKFKVKNESGDVVLRIEGPIFPCSCCGTDVVFDVNCITSPKAKGSFDKDFLKGIHSRWERESWEDNETVDRVFT